MTGTDKNKIAFRGLVTNPNELAITGDGAMRQFTNGILTRPQLAQARRGIGLNAVANAAVNKFFNYDGGLLFHRGSAGGAALSSLAAGVITNITGNVVPTAGRLRACIANKNFYTAAPVVKRLSGATSTPIAAGGLFAPGFDPAYTTLSAGTTLDHKVAAYRCVFGFYDPKGNLHLGGVSSRLVVTNYGSAAVNPTVRVIVPSEATTSHFVQLYRTEQVDIGATPDDECGLVFEQQLKQGDITNKYLEITDVCPDSLRGTTIYTAQSLHDLPTVGINQTNRPPPGCVELCEHKGRAWYGNTTQPGDFLLSILSVGGTDGIQAGDILRITSSASISLTAVRDFSATLVRTGGNLVTATTTESHGYATNDYVMVTSLGDTFGHGPFQVTVTGATTFTYAEVAANGTLESVNVNKCGASGLANGTYVARSTGTVSNRCYITAENIVAALNKHTTNTDIWGSIATGTEDTITEILFRGRTSVTGGFFVHAGAGSKRDCFSPQLLPLPHTVDLSNTANVVTATVTSGTQSFKVGEQVVISPGGAGSGSSVFGAGPHTITAIDTTGPSTTFTYAETSANGTLAAQTATITPQDVGESVVESLPNRVYYSKVQEPEATTTLGYLDVGSPLGAIKVMLSQRGQIWVWKTDGIFRITGDDETNFNVEALDTSIVMRATESVVLFENRCWGLTDRGVIAISESGIEVMSNAITDDLTRAWQTVYDNAAVALAGGYGVIGFETDCFATAYESDHTYILHIPSFYALDGAPALDGLGLYGGCPLAYAYNTESGAWALWDWGQSPTATAHAKRCAIVSTVDDRMYLGDGYAADGLVFKERKALTGADYRDTTPVRMSATLQRVGTTVTATVATTLVAIGDYVVLAAASGTFTAGPHLVTGVTGTTFTYTQGSGAAGPTAGLTAIREQGIAKTWQWILQTGAAPMMEKRWDELKFIFGQRATYFPTTLTNSQKAFYLALANETASVAAYLIEAQETQISRVWVPSEVARGARLLITLTHSTIDEAFDLAGLGLKVEVLGGATTK